MSSASSHNLLNEFETTNEFALVIAQNRTDDTSLAVTNVMMIVLFLSPFLFQNVYAGDESCNCRSGPEVPLVPVGTTGDGCLFYGAEPSTWWAAEETCANRGGHLSSILDDAVNTMLISASNHAGLYWIGAQYKDEQWKWSAGANVDLSKWQEGKCSPC